MSTGVDELFERWQPAKEHAEEAGRLHRVLDWNLFNSVRAPHLLRVSDQAFDVEEAYPKMYPPDVYPVVYIDKQGRRYSIEVTVTVTVTALPSVEVERQRGLELEQRLAGQTSLHPDGGPGA